MRGMPPGRIAGPGELFLYSFLYHLTLKGDGKPHTFRLRLSKEMKTNNRPFSAGRLRGELRFFYRGRPAFGTTGLRSALRSSAQFWSNRIFCSGRARRKRRCFSAGPFCRMESEQISRRAVFDRTKRSVRFRPGIPFFTVVLFFAAFLLCFCCCIVILEP